MSGALLSLRVARRGGADELDLVVEAKCGCWCSRGEQCVACSSCSSCCRCAGGAVTTFDARVVLEERGPGRSVDQVGELVRAAQAAAFESRVEIWAQRALARVLAGIACPECGRRNYHLHTCSRRAPQ